MATLTGGTHRRTRVRYEHDLGSRPTTLPACEDAGPAALLLVGRRCSDSDERVLAESTVVEVPTRRHRETFGVSFAHVVGVRIALGGEVVEPDLRAAVVIRQGDHCPFCTTGARTLADPDPFHAMHHPTVDRRSAVTGGWSQDGRRMVAGWSQDGRRIVVADAP